MSLPYIGSVSDVTRAASGLVSNIIVLSHKQCHGGVALQVETKMESLNTVVNPTNVQVSLLDTSMKSTENSVKGLAMGRKKLSGRLDTVITEPVEMDKRKKIVIVRGIHWFRHDQTPEGVGFSNRQKHRAKEKTR